MVESPQRTTADEKRRVAMDLYEKVCKITDKGKDAQIKKKKDGKLKVYEVDMHEAQ